MMWLMIQSSGCLWLSPRTRIGPIFTKTGLTHAWYMVGTQSLPQRPGLDCRLLSGVYEGLKGSGNQINRAHTVLTLQKSPFWASLTGGTRRSRDSNCVRFTYKWWPHQTPHLNTLLHQEEEKYRRERAKGKSNLSSGFSLCQRGESQQTCKWGELGPEGSNCQEGAIANHIHSISAVCRRAAQGRRWLSDALCSRGNEGSKTSTANQWLSPTSKSAPSPEKKGESKWKAWLLVPGSGCFPWKAGCTTRV